MQRQSLKATELLSLKITIFQSLWNICQNEQKAKATATTNHVCDLDFRHQAWARKEHSAEKIETKK